jgi:membrane-bound lytic murein transglycosylase D
LRTLINRIGLLALALLVASCAAPESRPDGVDAATAGKTRTKPESPVLSFREDPTKPGALPLVPPPLDSTRLPPFEGRKEEIARAPALPRIDRTVRQGDVWQRIRDGFSMPDLAGPLVAEKTAWYVARPDYLKRVFDRSRPYLYHIVDELEKRGLPTELALLPMVESSFNPMAYSRAHASGLWQFIPGTGKRYELAQNMWYDGRRDIVASTNAALSYLKDVYDMHGDWHLALASYNWGENAVARALEKNRKEGKPLDYSSINMPAETRHYVPKLQALKNIVANPALFGIDLDPIPNQVYFATVNKKRDIDVLLAAKLAEMPVEEFIALNPGFSRPVIRTEVSPRIVLPADRVDTFHANLTKHDDKSLVSWQTYQPKKGETLESIAKRFGVGLGQLKEVNGIGPRVRGMPELLVVPSAPGTVAQREATRLPIMYAPPIPVAGPRTFVHTVRVGETLPAIAGHYRISVEDLRRANKIGRLAVGQKLVVQTKGTPTPARAKPVSGGKPVASAKPGKPRQASKPVKKSSK